jgi:hypothetical protein
MTVAELTQITAIANETDVLSWRIEQLEVAGYEHLDACELALRTDVDLHRARDLRRRGCPSGTTVRILL